MATFLEEQNYVRLEMGCGNETTNLIIRENKSQETISPYIGYHTQKYGYATSKDDHRNEVVQIVSINVYILHTNITTEVQTPN
jgi:hypothetical protein